MSHDPATSHPKTWTSHKPFLLVGGQHSYFTGKLRAYMDARRIPYTEVASTMKIFPLIRSATKVNFIPVVVTPDGSVMQDTSEIMDYFEALPSLRDRPLAVPSSPRQKVASLIVEMFADEWMVLMGMHYRWSFPEQRAYVDCNFGRLAAPWTSGEERKSLADLITGRFEGSLPFLGVHEETIPAVEAEYKHILDTLDPYLDSHKYLLGDRPSLADIALQGPLFAHLFRDPVPGTIMKTRAPNVAHWVERLQALPGVLAQDNPHELTADGTGIELHTDSDKRDGLLLGDDAVSEPVLCVIRMMADTQLDVVLDTATLTSVWARDNPDTVRLPRSLGVAPFSMPVSPAQCAAEVGTRPRVTATRAVFPFVLWMAQRVTDVMDGLGRGDRMAVDEMLDTAAPGTADKFRVLSKRMAECRVRRDGCVLVVDRRPRPKL